VLREAEMSQNIAYMRCFPFTEKRDIFMLGIKTQISITTPNKIYGGSGMSFVRLLAAIKSKIYIRRNWAPPKKNTLFAPIFQDPCLQYCILYCVRNIIFICGSPKTCWVGKLAFGKTGRDEIAIWNRF